MGVNRYFFDCWSDPVHQPFIHCPSPFDEDKKIKFNSSYEITCNDVIIEPQNNKIYFDEAGRIHCRGISTEVEMFI